MLIIIIIISISGSRMSYLTLSVSAMNLPCCVQPTPVVQIVARRSASASAACRVVSSTER